jgi:cellulose biosynthesis protein BcsQ
MIKIVVIDATAASRSKLVEKISAILAHGGKEFQFLPSVDIKPLSLDEASFHAEPDLLILGEGLVATGMRDIIKLRTLYQRCSILAIPPLQKHDLSTIEHLARVGINDLLPSDFSSKDLLYKLILISKKVSQDKHGTLIAVTSGKGGAGCTSVTAALGETLLGLGKKVVLVDLDLETQDLARFLHVRPYINEELQGCIRDGKSVTAERVHSATLPVWADDERLQCYPAFLGSQLLFSSSDRVVQAMHTSLEKLDEAHEITIVDCAGIVGPLYEMVLRAADKVLFVVPNDPAALFASVHRVSSIIDILGSSAQIHIVEHMLCQHGTTGSLIRDEFLRASGAPLQAWIPHEIPFSRRAARWPGSGGTPVSQGDSKVTKMYRNIVRALGIGDLAAATGAKSQLTLSERVTKLLRLPAPRTESQAAESAMPVASLNAQEEILAMPAATPAPQAQTVAPLIQESTVAALESEEKLISVPTIQ